MFEGSFKSVRKLLATKVKKGKFKLSSGLRRECYISLDEISSSAFSSGAKHNGMVPDCEVNLLSISVFKLYIQG